MKNEQKCSKNKRLYALQSIIFIGLMVLIGLFFLPFSLAKVNGNIGINLIPSVSECTCTYIANTTQAEFENITAKRFIGNFDDDTLVLQVKNRFLEFAQISGDIYSFQPDDPETVKLGTLSRTWMEIWGKGNITTTEGFFVGDGRYITNLPAGTESDPLFTTTLNKLTEEGFIDLTFNFTDGRKGIIRYMPNILGFIGAQNYLFVNNETDYETNITVNGEVNATYFLGDGSRLTNLPAGGSESDPVWNANFSTFVGCINNESYLSTYNSSYITYLNFTNIAFLNQTNNFTKPITFMKNILLYNSSGNPSVNISLNTSITGDILTFTGISPYNNSLGIDLSASSSNVYIRRSGTATALNWADWGEVVWGNLKVSDDKNLYFGTGYDVWERWSTTGNNSLQIGLTCGSEDYSGYYSIMERADMGHVNRTPATPTSKLANPTLRIYSNDEGQMNDYIDIYHSNTSANIRWWNDNLLIGSYVGARTIDLGYSTNDATQTKTITSNAFLCNIGDSVGSMQCNLPDRAAVMNYVCVDEYYNFYESIDPCDTPEAKGMSTEERITTLENNVTQLFAENKEIKDALCEYDKIFKWCK